MKTKILVLVGLITVLQACSDNLLNIPPTSYWKVEDFYSNKFEVEMALSGIYGKLANNTLYGTSLSIVMEAGTDECYANDGGLSYAASRYTFTPSDGNIRNVWTQLYSCIQGVNMFEKNLKPSTFSTEVYNRYLAKALFYRALCYFNLANWWGPVPLRLTPVTKQSDNSLAPSPVLDVYKQVEKDLQFAAKYLSHAKDPDYIPGEPNSMAAHGLLARLYLRMGGYQPYLSANEADCYLPDNSQYFQNALDQCDTIIYQDAWHSIVPYTQDSLSYRTHFLNYLQDRYDTKESLFEITFGYLQDKGLSVSGSLGNINGVEFVNALDIPRGFCKINASVALYNLYMLNPTDKRFSWSIPGYRNVWVSSQKKFLMSYIMDKPLEADYGVGKYRRWEPKDINALKNAPSARISGAEYVILNNTKSATDPNYTSINFPILRYSDVLLMYAEAAIGGKNGSISASQKALDCLNTVRKRAGIAEFTDTDHDTFFKELVDERMRELCFEGLRKQDLIRWNLLEDKLEESANAIKYNVAYVPNNGTHLVFLSPSTNFDKIRNLSLPYPQQEVQINYDLDQKPNW